MKKAIIKLLITLFVLISIVSIIIYILGFVSKNEILQIIGFVSTIISPSMLLGIIIKFIMNKKQMRDIDKKLNSVGLNLTLQESKEINKEYKNNPPHIFRVKNYVFIEKDDKIIIKFNNDGLTPIQIRENFYYSLGEYKEKKRKDFEKDI